MKSGYIMYFNLTTPGCPRSPTGCMAIGQTWSEGTVSLPLIFYVYQCVSLHRPIVVFNMGVAKEGFGYRIGTYWCILWSPESSAPQDLPRLHLLTGLSPNQRTNLFNANIDVKSYVNTALGDDVVIYTLIRTLCPLSVINTDYDLHAIIAKPKMSPR